MGMVYTTLFRSGRMHQYLPNHVCYTINLIKFRTPGKEDQLIGSNLLERVNSFAELLLCCKQRCRFIGVKRRKCCVVIQNVFPALPDVVRLKGHLHLCYQTWLARSARFLPALFNTAKDCVDLFNLAHCRNKAISITSHSLDGSWHETTQQNFRSMCLYGSRPNGSHVGLQRVSGPDASHLVYLLFQVGASALIVRLGGEKVIFSHPHA